MLTTSALMCQALATC